MNIAHDGDITPGTNSYYGDVNVPVKPIIKTKRQWGAFGTRYDEQCSRCGNETEIDNNTELCERCSK